MLFPAALIGLPTDVTIDDGAGGAAGHSPVASGPMREERAPGSALEQRLGQLYESRFPVADRASRVELWRVLTRHFFDRFVPPDGVVVDLGAGHCDFINQVSACRRIAIDLSPETREFAAPDVEVHTVPLGDVDRVVAADSVDLVFASNVFEHLRGADALLDTLDSVRRVLSARGRLVVLQPNIRFVGGAFWDFLDHTLPLTDKGMCEALRLADFDVVESRPRFLPYTTKSRLPQWSPLVRIYLALPIAQRLFGKQMLVVARPSTG
jgi:SAM-dependent methyltransferase